MLYQQLLHDFVDGTLDFPEEIALFSELHSNDNLRSELKMLILMGRSVAHDIDAFIPAPESRQAIFARLGFASEGTMGGGALRGGLLRGSLHGIAGGIVGALLTALVILGFDLHLMPAVQDTAAVTARNTAGSSAVNPPAGPAFSEKGPAAASPVIAPISSGSEGAVSRRSPVMRVQRTTQNDMETRREMASQTFPASISRVMPRNSATIPARSMQEIAQPSSRSDLSPLPVTSPSLESRGFALPPISIGYHTIAARSFAEPPEALANQSNALLRDKSLEISYRLDATRTIALEMGQEEFYQRFEEQLENGDFIRHEQNPVLLWGGASFRQSFPLGSKLSPFVSILAGGTRVGPVGRLSVGTSYTLVPEIDLFAGAELSALAYGLESRWYFTPRYGMTYGIRVNF